MTAGQDGAWTVEDVSRPRQKFDSPNPGVTRVAFTCPLRDGKLSFVWRSAVSVRTAKPNVQMVDVNVNARKEN